MKSSFSICLLIFFSLNLFCETESRVINIENIPYKLYPEVNLIQPELPSPFTTKFGKEYVVAVTKDSTFAIIDVTLSNERMVKQLIIDTLDFPELAKTGLHSETRLKETKTITGRTISEINTFAFPRSLSHDGFLAYDESVLSVILADNRIVSKLKLTHPKMAKPLFHVLNMIETDLHLNRWNKARHKWENINYFFYNGKKVYVECEDTKGGQQSIFNDGIDGALYINIWRELDTEEINYLKKSYSYLSTEQFKAFIDLLTKVNTGEMEPQYIMRYGFYEGHTFWRTDPISLSVIFNLIDIKDIDNYLDKRLYEIVTTHHNSKIQPNSD
jgi:hypothetical protein